MLKKLISTAILSSVIGSVSANPELGYMTLNTDRNHFFNATIAIDALPAELADKKLKVKLGSITDFYRHDIEYDKQVGSLRFKVTKDASGKPVIKVRSIREITAEQLQAVVKLYVGRQKVYGIYDFQVTPNKKEHHVSLNLLNSDHKPEEKQRYTKNAKSRTTLSSEAIASSVTTSREEAKRVDISSDLQYRVLSGKTISQIAMELLPEYPETSNWQALMEQLVSINPDAFVNGDINQLKSDAVLNLPARESSPQITSVDTDRVVNSKADLVTEELAVETTKNKIKQPSQDYSPEISAKASIDEPLAPPSVEGAKTPLAAVEKDRLALSKEHKPEEVIQPSTTTAYELEAEDVGERKSYLVSKGETISLIAIKLYPDYPEQESWTGLMNDLIELNPDAFIDGDINQLRAGTELTLPDQTQTNHGSVASNTVDQSAISASEVIEPLSEKQKSPYKIEPETDTEAPFREEHFSITRGDAADPIAGDTYSSASEQSGEVYQVIQGETISGIAMRLFPIYSQAKSWKQLMDQLVMLNPDAFVGGDINQIREGFSLLLPVQQAFNSQGLVAHQEGTPDEIESSPEIQGSVVAARSGETYQVTTGDSIGSIAIKLVGEYSKATDWKTVMAQLVTLNPDAFINGDITRLRADAVLTLPDRADVEVEAENFEQPEPIQADAPVNNHEEITDTPQNTTDEASPSLGSIESDSSIYQVSHGETISAIAIKLTSEYPEAGQWQAVMSRLVALNPEAFIDGDVNRLLANALLILPGRDDFEVEAENQELPEEALATVNKKTAQTTYEPVTQVEATSSTEIGDQYQVSQGESVRSIAIKLAPEYPEARGWQGVMEQLVNLNPEAFIDGDAGKLRSDALLKLPSKSHFDSEVEAENHEQPRADDFTEEGVSQTGTYKVSKGESLRSISLQLLSDYPEADNIQAIMDQLVALNPEAFIDGDARRLQAEFTLTLPSQDDFQRDSIAETGNSEINETLTRLNKQDYGYSSAENIYRVAKGENLRAIATELLSNYPNVSQVEPVMELLVTLNPQAFIDGDARKLLAESTLNLPSQDEFINQSLTEEVVDITSNSTQGVQQEENSDVNAAMAKLSKGGAENQYQVSEGESISTIAMKLLPNYPQTQDWKVVMNNLILLNPDAFIGGDESRLRSDAVLMIPGQGELEIEAENQELPDTQLPDTSFNNLEGGRNINLALANLPDDQQLTDKKKVK